MTQILYNRAVKLFMDKISAGFDEYGAHDLVMNKYGKPVADKILSEAKSLEKQIRGNPRKKLTKFQESLMRFFENTKGTIHSVKGLGKYRRNPRGNMSSHWMVHYPGEVYANDLRFNKPASKREVLAYLRRFHNVKRLTRGTEVWIA